MRELSIEEFKEKYQYKTGFGFTRHIIDYINNTIVVKINDLENKDLPQKDILTDVRELGILLRSLRYMTDEELAQELLRRYIKIQR